MLHMDRHRTQQRRVNIEDPAPPPCPDESPGTSEDDVDDCSSTLRLKLRPSSDNVTEGQEPFMGIKARRKASLRRDHKGDYLDVASQACLIKILEKHGDRQVVFADKVLKFTATGKIKRRILLITNVAVYIIDPETDALKRRIALAAIDKICLSELNDNFFAIIIPTEYDLLMASTRKTEIVTVLVEVTKNSDYLLGIDFSNRIEYRASAYLSKEVQFEEVEGGVKSRILKK